MDIEYYPVSCGDCGFMFTPTNVGTELDPLHRCPNCKYVSEPCDFPDVDCPVHNLGIEQGICNCGGSK